MAVILVAAAGLPTATAQIVIKERLELNAEGADGDLKFLPGFFEFDPILRPLGLSVDNQDYLVVKSGWLKVQPLQASAYAAGSPAEHLLRMQRRGNGVVSDTTVGILPNLPAPLTVRDANQPVCMETSYFFRQTGNYSTRLVEDSFILEDNPNSNFNEFETLTVNPDGKALIKADLSGLQTNGSVQSASFGLRVSSFSGLNELRYGSIFTDWDETTVTWANQPKAGNFRAASGLAEEQVVHRFDVTSMTSSWIDLPASNQGIMIKTPEGVPDGVHAIYVSSEVETLFPTDPRPNFGIKFKNPNPDPGAAPIELGYVQAGDTLKFDYRGFDDLLVDPEDVISFSGGSDCLNEEMTLQVLIDEDETRKPYLQVLIEPDTARAAPGDTVALAQRLAFDNGATAEFAPDQTFTVELTEGSQYGTLIEQLEVAVSDTSDFFAGIPAGFGFRAIDNLSDSAGVTLKVTTQVLGPDPDAGAAPPVSPSSAPPQPGADPDDGIGTQQLVFVSGIEVSGTRQIPVVPEEELEITIEIAEEDTVWPTILRRAAQRRLDFSVMDSVVDDVEVRLTKNDEPVNDHDITIRAEWIAGSGGHNHQGTVCTEGPAQLNPPLLSRGYIVDKTRQDSARGQLQTLTDNNGEVQLRYRAPRYGGKMALVASVIEEEDTLTARDTVLITVPGLDSLADGTNYEKVGGTRGHHGPRLDTENADFLTPDNNHFAIEAFRDSLVSIADAWHDTVSTDSTQDNRQTPLNINDMSLPHGGLFDVCGRWDSPHSLHRVGRDADIRTTRSFPLNNAERNAVLLKQIKDAGKPLRDDQNRIIYKNRLFEEIIEDKEGNPPAGIHSFGKPNEHYHIFFYPSI